MSKHVAFSRKEISIMIKDHLETGEAKAREYAIDNGPYGASAFQAGYYKQALKQIKVYLDARYEV